MATTQDLAHLITRQLAGELKVRLEQVQATIDLLDGGATVPFVARYRKEATGGLDDIQLRELESRLHYLRELEDRRASIIKSITEQGKMTAALLQSLQTATVKQELEDLYLPYKPKRRTKAMIAREAGLEPLADALWQDPNLDPSQTAAAYVKSEKSAEGGDFTTLQACLDGARDILSERWAEEAALLSQMRDWMWACGLLTSHRAKDSSSSGPGGFKEDPGARFADYYDYAEPIKQVPSHRALAVFRGRSLGLLDASLQLPEGLEGEAQMAQHLGWQHRARAADDFIKKCVSWCWRVKLSLSLERDLFTRLRESAEQVAIHVFAENLRDLLLAAPAGPRVVMGLDPGIRTGVKVAVVDATGRVLATHTVYPHEPRKDWDGALHALRQLCITHGVQLIAIGNGTASRETDKLAGELIKMLNAASEKSTPPVQKIVVSEAGASVYSASEYASQELPDLDVSLRGAVSIARRLQDPLAELVKIEPKSIGVGQYQHDVNQSELARSLETVIEDCVNRVGVDLNTASAPLLSHISGLSPSIAKSIVRWRDAQGAFKNRQQLLQVTGLGAKTFEQSAGFLRIREGENPLDQTGVHPEAYPVVERMLAQVDKPISQIMGQADVIRQLQPQAFADARFGIVTVRDILTELEKPGRDPRPDFQVARFNEGVEKVSDLQVGMILEGTVSNVAAFGAFVDIGVHQDGLVHVSQLSNKFVNDAREVVKTGQIVKVRVTEVDAARGRISLSMKLQDDGSAGRVSAARQPRSARQTQAPVANSSAMAAAFAKLQQKP